MGAVIFKRGFPLKNTVFLRVVGDISILSVFFPGQVNTLNRLAQAIDISVDRRNVTLSIAWAVLVGQDPLAASRLRIRMYQCRLGAFAIIRHRRL